MDNATELTGEHDYAALRRMLKALDDVVRLNMIDVLASTKEISVTDLAQMLSRPISQPLVSWHLSVLRRHGFVRTRRHGRQVYCSLDTGRYQSCLRLLSELARVPIPTAAQSDTPEGMLGVHHRS